MILLKRVVSVDGGGCTLQQGRGRGHRLGDAVFAVDGLQKLRNTVIFVHDDDPHLEDSQGGRGWGRGSRSSISMTMSSGLVQQDSSAFVLNV